MHDYELQIKPEMEMSQSKTREQKFPPIAFPLLVKYALWFCHFRWVFIVVLTTFGILGLFPTILNNLGLHANTIWAFITAGILFILNTGYTRHVLQMEKSKDFNRILTNIWVQIVLDLFILTGVIYYLGTLETYLPFAYLFHIVLACIFFSSRQSLIITLMVCFLFVASVISEKFMALPSAGIYTNNALLNHSEYISIAPALNVLSALGIWLLIWYLASHLSGMVREREYELAQANQYLKRLQEEKTKHLLRITHELKSPFAAIDANIHLLLRGHCGDISAEALSVMKRISLRSRKLSHEIKEMLQLANLSTVTEESLQRKKLDLVDIIQQSKEQLQPLAEKQGITFQENLQSAMVYANEDHMRMLFENLISNAITYSHKQGIVKLTCEQTPGGGPVVTIVDHGIGIQKEKLDKIFDEFYRTNEAVRHNGNSTGLGLAIVSNVARRNNIRVLVSSAPQKGTKLTLQFPLLTLQE